MGRLNIKPNIEVELDTPITLSIVIPVYNEATGIIDVLQALQSFRSTTTEIIVVDGGSQDETVQRAADLADRVIVTTAGRARQMNAGSKVASGRYLLFLHADTYLQGCSLTSLLGAMTAGAWGFFPVRLSGRSWLLRCVERGMNWRSRFTAVATGDQALWFQRKTFEELSGFSDLPLMEDVEITKRARHLAPPVVMPWSLLTSSRRWEEHGIVHTVLKMWFLRLAYVLRVSPERLSKIYRPKNNGLTDGTEKA